MQFFQCSDAQLVSLQAGYAWQEQFDKHAANPLASLSWILLTTRKELDRFALRVRSASDMHSKFDISI